MKILIVTQYFYPENFRINDLCLELKAQGHEIQVLTGLPNYPEGKIFSGYGYFKKMKTTWNEIEVIRVPIFPRMKNSLALLINYISFALFGSLYVWFHKMDQVDIVHVFEVSPVSVAFPAIAYKKKYKVPIIMNVQDLWPDNVVAVTRLNNKRVVEVIGKMVDYIYNQCDLLLTSSSSFIDKIAQRGHCKSKIKYWPQYVNDHFKKVELDSDDELHSHMEGSFNLVFTGNLGYAQGLDVLIQAAEQLKEYKEIKWHLIGDGRAKTELEQLVKEKELENQVIFHGRKPEIDIPKYLSVADCALLILKNDPVFEMTLPAKLQSYLACEIPILGCVDGIASKTILEANAGFVSSAGDVDSFASSVLTMFEHSEEERNQIGSNGRTYFEQYFKKETLLEQLNEHFHIIKNNK